MKVHLKKAVIGEDLINKITHIVPLREKAFFTIMRQSGLSPQTLTAVKIKNLEPSLTIPRKIDTRQDSTERIVRKPPNFIGKEGNNYINRYLVTRKDKTPDSPLFVQKANSEKEIITDNESRAFRQALEKLEKSYQGKFTLLSLTKFYREKARQYQAELDNNPNESDEFYRDLYAKRAMPFLEIESQITISINPTRKRYRNELWKRDTQIKEMKQTITADNEYISSILTLLYNNRGDPETGENEQIGDNFIELWKETRDKQLKNLWDSWQSNFKIELLPGVDIIEELTKTLKRIKKPFDELEKSTR